MHQDYPGKISLSVFKAVVSRVKKVKKTDRFDFAPVTLICMRAVIQRFLTSSSVDHQINIIDGQEFKLPNPTLKAFTALCFTAKP